MRLLLTAQPIYSHVMPAIVPLARAAQALGHDVAVATAPSMAGELAQHGVAHLPLPGVPDQAALRTDPALGDRFGMPQQVMAEGSHTIAPSVWRQIARAYAGPMADCFAAELLAVAPAWRPDVIVREPAEYGGYLAAERLGIPHATLDISAFAALDLPLVGDVLDAGRAELGLPAVHDERHPWRYLRAGLVPEAWYPPSLRVATGRSYRLPAPQPAVDGWYAALPDDRPLVFASLGSLVLSLPGVEDLLPMLVAALGALPCTAVVSLSGLPHLADRLGAVPSNVHVTPFAPQRALLAGAELFVTHAGFGATADAIAAGVPMVALPVLADQPHNARRSAELGLGLTLDVDSISPARIAEACRTVLDDPAYRWRARAMQRRLFADPGLEQLVSDLAALRP